MGLLGFFTKEKKESLDKGLEKTKENFFSRLTKAVVVNRLLMLMCLITSKDIGFFRCGVETTLKIIKRIEERVKRVNM